MLISLNVQMYLCFPSSVEPPRYGATSSVVFLTQIVYEVDHLCLTHSSTDGSVRLPQYPARDDYPQTIEEGEVEIAMSSRSALLQNKFLIRPAQRRNQN